MKVSERRIAEWWEAPGIDGREDYDEEILYLNSLTETIALPRWAVFVRDQMPRWGFEPCAARFFEGLEQILNMIGEERAYPRLGSCGDVPLSVYRQLQELGTALVQWGQGRGSCPWLAEWSPERGEAVQALGELSLAVCQGPVALDSASEKWAQTARYELTQRLVDGEEAPLPRLFRHACAYNLVWNLQRMVEALGRGEIQEPVICGEALRLAPQLDPHRIPLLRELTQALVHWLQERLPSSCLELQVFRLIGPRDAVRRWLVASLYKTLKLWLVHVDTLLGERHTYYALL